MVHLVHKDSTPNKPPVLVQVSEQRALGIMAETSSWEEFAWSVGISKEVNVLDEWDEAGAKFVVIDWSQE
jgi:NMD protein affecting ribosome stability and mRNA decay